MNVLLEESILNIAKSLSLNTKFELISELDVSKNMSIFLIISRLQLSQKTIRSANMHVDPTSNKDNFLQLCK